MEPLLELARARRIAILEDACQAHGALHRGRPVGTLRRRARHRRALVLPDQEPGRARRRRGRARERSRARRRACASSGTAGRRAATGTRASASTAAWTSCRPPSCASGSRISRPGPSAGARSPPSTCGSSPPPGSACRASSPTRGPSTISSSCATPGATHSPKRSPSSGSGRSSTIRSRCTSSRPSPIPPVRQRLPVAERACAEILSLPLYPELTRRAGAPRRRGRARSGRPRPVLGSGLV